MNNSPNNSRAGRTGPGVTGWPARLVLGQAYEQKGMLREAIAELETAVRLAGGSPVYQASLAHLGLGNNVKVFDLLNAAVRERSPRAAFLGVEPRFDGLRADPKFQQLLRSVGL